MLHTPLKPKCLLNSPVATDEDDRLLHGEGSPGVVGLQSSRLVPRTDLPAVLVKVRPLQRLRGMADLLRIHVELREREREKEMDIEP